jgi:hypothetical protein
VKSGIHLDESARVQPVPQSPSFLSRFSPLAALILALSASAGCHVGESPGDTGDEGAPAADAGDGAGDDDGADDGDGGGTPDGGGNSDDPCASPAVEPTPQSSTHLVGYDYGVADAQGCLGDCHREGAQDGSAAFVWQAGGAIYTDPSYETAASGAVVVIEEMGSGTKHVAVASENGQFRFLDQITYPAITYACPPQQATNAMVTPLNEGNGNCGEGNTCHSTARPIVLNP